MAELSNEELRKALQELGEQPGPINDFTRGSYVKKYNKLKNSKPASNQSNNSTTRATSGKPRSSSPSRTSNVTRKSSRSPAREASKPSPQSPPPSQHVHSPKKVASAVSKSTQADSEDEEVERPSGRLSLDLHVKPRPLLESTRLSFGIGAASALSDRRYEYKTQAAAAVITDSDSGSEEVEIIKPKPLSSASTRLTYLRRPGAVPPTYSQPTRFTGSANFSTRVKPQKKSWIPQLKSFIQMQKTVIGTFVGVALVLLMLYAGYRMLNRPETLEGLVGMDDEVYDYVCGETGAVQRGMCTSEQQTIDSMKVIKYMRSYLSTYAGDFACGHQSSAAVETPRMLHHLRQFSDKRVDKYWNSITWLIHKNPHWGISLNLVSGDSSDSDLTWTTEKVASLESSAPSYSLACILRFYLGKLVLVVIAVLFLFGMGFAAYKLGLNKKQEQRVLEQQTQTLVQQVVALLEEQNRLSRIHLTSLPYLPVNEIRDRLMSTNDRAGDLWPRVTKRMSRHGRVRAELQMIHGEEYLVWRLVTL